jgi:hypothetical protein
MRSLSPSAETTSVHLSFFARVSGVMSCLLSIWSAFLDGLFTNRDRESLALLHQNAPSVDHLTTDDSPSQPPLCDGYLDGPGPGTPRREAARKVGDSLGDVRPLLVKAVRVAGERRGYAADARSQRVELLGDGLRVQG